ncbi:histidine kinase dimerization/phospho-acceptor domain-containing protein [Streptomyces sp. NPDC048387]|uniref:sensor histidine kinase n=1 Tax=Streptomyces sp. NPDC048387 TaxID=3365542 RepID=UPI0037127D26
MRARVVRVALVAATVALILLAVPLAVAVRYAFFADEGGELERDAMAAVVQVGPEFATGDPVELHAARPGEGLALYDTAGRLRAGAGPAHAGGAVPRALTGSVAQSRSDGELVVAVPVSSGEQVIGVIRASTRASTVWARVLWGWAALLGLCLVALGAAVIVARRQASILAAPLEALAGTSLAVADGDLTARAEPSTIAEIDEVARAHNTMVDRLAQLLEHERHFTANASHQLRTPLAGLQLGLEAALADPDADPRAALAEAAERSRHLDHTIEEVLRLARSGAGPLPMAREQSAEDVLEAAGHRWHGAFAEDGRRLTTTWEPQAGGLEVPGRTVEQIVDILLDNAHRHGRGTVTLTVRDLGTAIALDVADEGTADLDPQVIFQRGIGEGSGIGLALARQLAAGADGRLSLTSTAPTRFTLLLPLREEP